MRRYGCPATNKVFHVFDKVTHQCACGRWDRGYAPKKQAVEGRDECQVCEGRFALRDGLLVHHGFTRPGIGFIVGDCLGVKRKPFPAWDALEEHRVAVVRQHKIHQKLLEELPNATVLTKKEERTKRDENGRSVTERGRYVFETIRTPIHKPAKAFVSSSGSWTEEEHKAWGAWERWKQQLEIETTKLAREIKGLERERDRVVARIEKAKGMTPLPAKKW